MPDVITYIIIPYSSSLFVLYPPVTIRFILSPPIYSATRHAKTFVQRHGPYTSWTEFDNCTVKRHDLLMKQSPYSLHHHA